MEQPRILPSRAENFKIDKTRSSEALHDMRRLYFLDLDGTWLPNDYSLNPAYEIVSQIYRSQLGQPQEMFRGAQRARVKPEAIAITSKSEPEIREIYQKLGIWGMAPFIAENSDLYLPHGYFQPHESSKSTGYEAITLGEPVAAVMRSVKTAAEIAHATELIVTPDQMGVEGFARYTGLSPHEAELALQKRHLGLYVPTETYLRKVDPSHELPSAETIHENSNKLRYMCQLLEADGKTLRDGGRFTQVMPVGATKGDTAEFLMALHTQKGEIIDTIGFGNRDSDLDFLMRMRRKYLVGDERREYTPQIEGLHIIDHAGPAGVLHVMNSLNHGSMEYN